MIRFYIAPNDTVHEGEDAGGCTGVHGEYRMVGGWYVPVADVFKTREATALGHKIEALEKAE